METENDREWNTNLSKCEAQPLTTQALIDDEREGPGPLRRRLQTLVPLHGIWTNGKFAFRVADTERVEMEEAWPKRTMPESQEDPGPAMQATFAGHKAQQTYAKARVAAFDGTTSENNAYESCYTYLIESTESPPINDPVVVNAVYYETIIKRHPDAQPHIAGAIEAVRFLVNNECVAVLMPIRQ